LQKVLQQIGRDNLPDSVIALAQGSPGAAISAIAQFQRISTDLLAAVQQPPQRPLQALELAKQIDRELDVEAQIWLIDYLQNYYWQAGVSSQARNLLNMVQSLEEARQQIVSYVQPRLVWEIALLRYCG
jgi:DNA polymerase-3 subunit delta'